MSEDQGYSGKSLDCLKKNNAKVGDSIKITADLTYSGILMPRYSTKMVRVETGLLGILARAIFQEDTGPTYSFVMR